MTLEDILDDIHAMEADLLMFERKYGVLTETFYSAYQQGEEPEDDAWYSGARIVVHGTESAISD